MSSKQGPCCGAPVQVPPFSLCSGGHAHLRLLKPRAERPSTPSSASLNPLPSTQTLAHFLPFTSEGPTPNRTLKNTSPSGVSASRFQFPHPLQVPLRDAPQVLKLPSPRARQPPTGIPGAEKLGEQSRRRCWHIQGSEQGCSRAGHRGQGRLRGPCELSQSVCSGLKCNPLKRTHHRSLSKQKITSSGDMEKLEPL